ncbi:MAG: DNA repair protein RecO [Lachnospiraceae bacterium]|jgi:DNA repair protein RecO (recombination protein O)|nr:DNA repair protein RecO [Lachnospiraceae bacterium]
MSKTTSFTLTAIVLSNMPVGENDRRVVVLSKERGKQSFFAKGARKQGSAFMGSTLPFCFGEFTCVSGRSANTLTAVNLLESFTSLRNDINAVLFAQYFLEIADYYSREENDDTELLKLVFQSLRALGAPQFSKELVRSIFEIKATAVTGEGIDIKKIKAPLKPATVQAIEFILHSPVGKLYTFSVSEEVLSELSEAAKRHLEYVLDRPMKSAKML